MSHRFRLVGEGRIDIGIDIGWSKLKRSCALAVRGLDWDDPSIRSYRSPDGELAAQVRLFRLDELVRFLPDLLAAMRDHFGRTTLVVDGPLGTEGPPRHNRGVDAECRQGDFYQRVQPNDVTGETGRKYVEATYQVVDPFLKAAGVTPWVGRESAAGQLIVAETNPTVAMAMMLPVQDPDSLPSRKQPIELQPPKGRTRGRVISAKSDW